MRELFHHPTTPADAGWATFDDLEAASNIRWAEPDTLIEQAVAVLLADIEALGNSAPRWLTA